MLLNSLTDSELERLIFTEGGGIGRFFPTEERDALLERLSLIYRGRYFYEPKQEDRGQLEILKADLQSLTTENERLQREVQRARSVISLAREILAR